MARFILWICPSKSPVHQRRLLEDGSESTGVESYEEEIEFHTESASGFLGLATIEEGPLGFSVFATAKYA